MFLDTRFITGERNLAYGVLYLSVELQYYQNHLCVCLCFSFFIFTSSSSNTSAVRCHELFFEYAGGQERQKLLLKIFALALVNGILMMIVVGARRLKIHDEYLPMYLSPPLNVNETLPSL